MKYLDHAGHLKVSFTLHNSILSHKQVDLHFGDINMIHFFLVLKKLFVKNLIQYLTNTLSFVINYSRNLNRLTSLTFSFTDYCAK